VVDVEVVVEEVLELLVVLEVEVDEDGVKVIVKEFDKEVTVKLVAEVASAELSMELISGNISLVCDSDGSVFRMVFEVSIISSLVSSGLVVVAPEYFICQVVFTLYVSQVITFNWQRCCFMLGRILFLSSILQILQKIIIFSTNC
jgi:hypothetical protein